MPSTRTLSPPLPSSPPAVPPHMRDSWQRSTDSVNTVLSHSSRFHEHLPPPSPPSKDWSPVSRVGTMFIPSMLFSPSVPLPPAVPPRSPARPPRPPRDSSQENIIPSPVTYVEAPSGFSPDTPTAPTFPSAIFRGSKSPIKDRNVDNVDLERAQAGPSRTKSLLSHRLSRKIEAVRQFVNLPYPFHAPLPAPTVPIPPVKDQPVLEKQQGEIRPFSPGSNSDSGSLRPLIVIPQLPPTPRDYGYPRRMSVALPVDVDVEYHEKGERSLYDRHGRPIRRKDEKKKKKRLIIIIIVLVILIILAAILGGVFGTRSKVSSGTAVRTSTNTTLSSAQPVVTYTVEPTVAPITRQGTTYLATTTATVTFTTTPSPTPASTSATPSATPLSPAVQSCLTQFQISAPSNAASYPCGSCAPLIATLPNDLAPGFIASATDPNTGGISPGKILQFCSLQTIFLASANSTSSNPLSSGGWMSNCDPCSGWNGVTCDSAGRITELALAFPAVPQSLSEGSMSGLVGMQSLQVIGNGQVPAGTLPQSLLQLSGLVSLHLQTTGLTALPDNAFDAFKSLQQLTLAGNSNLGQTLPSSISGLPLTTLVVNGQNLETNLTALLSPTAAYTKTLQILDLSGNTLSSPLPSSLSAFTALNDINFSSNNLTTLPATLPASLKALVMSQNSGLKGALPSQVCSMGLQTCDFRGTGIAQSGSCGVCQFGVF